MADVPDDVQDYIDAIPEDMRGHVWHALGKELGGSHTDSGGNSPPPPPPPPKNP